MRPRRPFTILPAISLLLCVATGALWVRSYRHVDLFGNEGCESADRWQRGGSLSSSSGELSLEWWLRENEPGMSQRGAGWGFDSWPGQRAGAAWHGFSYQTESFDNAQPGSDGSPRPVRMTYVHTATIPDALLIVIFAMPGVVWFIRFKRRRRIEARIKQMRCPDCGYDLRASPARCPECGAINPHPV